jgi:hypothetical protein
MTGRGVAVVAACGALVGCGASGDEPPSKERYEDAVKAAEADLPPSKGFTAYAPVNFEGPETRAADELDEFADRIDAIEPPADVAHAQREWVDAMRAYVDETRRAVAAARRGNPTLLRERVRDGASPQVQARLDAALEEFKRKGYDVTDGVR